MRKEQHRDENRFNSEKQRPDEESKENYRYVPNLKFELRFFFKLLIVVWIIMFVLGLFLLPFEDCSMCHNLTNTPIATLICNNESDGNWSIRVGSIEPNVSIEKVLVDVYSNDSVVFTALLSDIHDAPDNYTEVWFIDHDNDTKLSNSDVIILNTQNDGLDIDRNSTFRLSYTRTTKTIGLIDMKDYIPKD